MTRNILYRRALAAVCVLLTGIAAANGDEMCNRLARFQAARFDHSEQPVGRRWVEMHWIGHWLDFDEGFGLKCVSSADTAARELCGWLSEHSSIEFPETLPQGMLTCYGFRFPRGSQWSGWKSDISFSRGDREVLLEVDFFTMRKESGAIRLSSFAKGKDQALAEMPPLAELGDTAGRAEQ